LNRAVDEIAAFLRAHPPFETLPEHELARLAGAAVEARFAAGETIFSQGSAPPAHVWVVRSGAVELVEHGRLLDLLRPGELFGYAAMLADLPTGFAARASEPTVCLSLPAEVSRPLLARPEGLRFVTRTILGRPVAGRPATAERGAAERAVGTLLRGPAVVCAPDTPIREAAARMTETGQSAVVVALADGALGILTDRDLRSRVVAAGLPLDAPVSAAMSAPAYTATEERVAGDVLVEMLDRGVRHFPVLTATGTLLGVVDDLDLFAAERRTPFHLRTAIARAPDADAVAEAARDLWPTVLALHDARVGAEQVGAIVSVVADALVRRLLDLAVAGAGEPPAPFAWLALGSLARREGVPSSDVDSALVWDGDDEDAEVRSYVQGVAARVIADLDRCGLHADAKGATAAHPLFARSLRAWGAAIDSWFDRPTQENALMVVSIVTDSRPVWGVHRAAPLADHLRAARARPGLLRLLARFALSYRPPTGFRGHLVVEHSGEHKGLLDLKRGGIVPIVDLARWAGMAAGATSISTRARLRAARDAGVLSGDDARVLEEAFALVTSLRLDHQVQQLRQGVAPDDHVRPDALSPLSRSYLKDAFRAVAGVQRRITTELLYGVA
jgi:CBS domain-containing protein